VAGWVCALVLFCGKRLSARYDPQAVAGTSAHGDRGRTSICSDFKNDAARHIAPPPTNLFESGHSKAPPIKAPDERGHKT